MADFSASVRQMKPQTTVPIMREMAKPRKTHIQLRGDFLAKDKEVSEGLPAVFHDLPEGAPLDRMGVAQWLVSGDNPLTARVIVNRVWHYHFGRGICDTPNDLGRMGGKPSHPELLDWLAVWFRDEAKGSLKELHRLIVTSEAYRQRSTSRQNAAKLDGDNRLLWRMNRLRLDAEQYRDSLRQISGRLDLSMGGKAVKQFVQKKGVLHSPVLDYKAYDWNRPDARRRSIYRLVWRGIPDPFMEAMDFPNLGLLAPRRSQTVSPLQSLVLFNHDFVLFHCRHLARRLAKPDPMKAMQWGGWRQIGPFKGGDFHELHSKTFPPEDRIDLKAEYSGLRWQSSELKDGIPLALAGENRVFYFHRSVRTAHPTMVELSLGSDDSIRIWLNGKAMLERKIERETEWLHKGVTARRKRNQGRLRALQALRAERPHGGRDDREHLRRTAGHDGVDGYLLHRGQAETRLHHHQDVLRGSFGGFQHALHRRLSLIHI